MKEIYQCFIPKKIADFPQDVEMELNVSSLAPGKRKYECKIVRCKVSSEKDKYSDQLWIRFNKGYMHPEPWSLDIIEEINRIPKEFLKN
jgi:phenylphosphate carboxylase gamma subunit